jgi:hypothetical protein
MVARWEPPRIDGAELRFDELPAMRALREAIRADRDLDGWMDTLIGPESSRQRRDLMSTLGWFFNRLVVDTRAYRVEESIFAALYAELEAAWLTRRVCIVAVVTLIGFWSTESFLSLGNGFRVRRTTDDEMHAAIQALAVPTETPSSPVMVTVRRFNQWALAYERTVDLIGGHSKAVPAALGPSPDELADTAQRLIMVLRLVVGGSVLSSREIRYFRVSPLDSASGSAMISRFGSVDTDRSCVLLDDHIQAVALSGIIWAGPSRVCLTGRPEWRCGGWCSHVGALKGSTGSWILLSRPKRSSAAQAMIGEPAPSVRMGQMVTQTPGIDAAVGVNGARIQTFLRAAYTTRNRMINANRSVLMSFERLRGIMTAELNAVVDDLDLLIRLTHRHV